MLWILLTLALPVRSECQNPDDCIPYTATVDWMNDPALQRSIVNGNQGGPIKVIYDASNCGEDSSCPDTCTGDNPVRGCGPVICEAGGLTRQSDEYAEKMEVLYEALANRMYKDSGSWCVYSMRDPQNVAFHWMGKNNCWRLRTSEKHANSFCMNPHRSVADKEWVFQRSDKICRPECEEIEEDPCPGTTDEYDECSWDWSLRGFCTEQFVEWMKLFCSKTCCSLGHEGFTGGEGR